MSTILYALGRWSYRHPWRVLVSWLLLLGLAGGGAVAFQQGVDNSFSIPGTEAQEAIQQLSRTFPQVSGTSAQIIVVTADGTSVDAEPYLSGIDETLDRLDGLDGVVAVTDPFDDTVKGLVSDDGSAAIVRVQFEGELTTITAETKADLASIADELRAELPPGSTAQLGGELYSSSLPTLSITEGLGVVIALIVLIIAFRSLLVSWLPLATALLGVGLSMALIFVSTAFASISSTTPLLALMLGLAVGIDYSLFIVARHQDQVRTGVDPEESTANRICRGVPSSLERMTMCGFLSTMTSFCFTGAGGAGGLLEPKPNMV